MGARTLTGPGDRSRTNRRCGVIGKQSLVSQFTATPYPLREAQRLPAHRAKPETGGPGESQDSTGLAGLIAGKGVLDDTQDVLLLVSGELAGALEYLAQLAG